MCLQNQEEGDKDRTSKSINILLIEDNEGDVRLIREMLKDISNISFKVEASGLLIKALKTLESRKFDAILLDLNLPDSVGIETASKTLEVVRDTPIIILTGLNEERLAISTVKMGIQDYLVKTQLNSMLLVRSIQYAIERKKTEQKLKESEEKYKDLFEQTPMAILLINFEGIIEDCNTSSEVLFGYTKKELLGIDFLKFDKIPLDTKLILAKSFSKFLTTGVPEQSEIQMYRKDGKMIWINSHPINVKIDEKSYVLVLIQDITERKKAEQELISAKNELSSIYEQTPLIIILVDNERRVRKANRLAVEFAGRPEGEMLGLRGGEALRCLNSLYDSRGCGFGPFCQSCNVRNVVLDTFETNLSKINVEASLPFKIDGEEQELFLLVSTVPLDIDGKTMVIVTINDITERKKAEYKLKESEEKYRSLIENAVMGILEIDMSLNKISYINPKLLEIVGYTKEELKDNSIFYKLIHPEDLEELPMSIRDRDVEFRIYSKEGKLKWLSGTRKYTISENGEPIKMRLWLQDITERKEIEEIKSNLLTRFSHEFKTPLISIKGFADFLLATHEDKLDKKALSFLTNIKNGSERLNSLVNTFIESSHLDRDFSKLELCSENLFTLIKTAIREVKGLADLRDHIINVNMPENLMVEIDKEKIYTVITNLIFNAIKYTPTGGIISIISKIEEYLNSISIIDNGIGFTSSEKEKLFKKFGKIERYGHGWDIITDGIGMGLYISKQIINEHGGKIWVESQGRNRGSTFTFTIPIRKNKDS